MLATILPRKCVAISTQIPIGIGLCIYLLLFLFLFNFILFIYLFMYFKIAHTFSLLLVLLLIEKINARCSCAAIAQLGERPTEDMKVPSSILGLGSRCTPALSKGLCGATLHYPFPCSTMHIISAAGN